MHNVIFHIYNNKLFEILSEFIPYDLLEKANKELCLKIFYNKKNSIDNKIELSNLGLNKKYFIKKLETYIKNKTK